MRLQICYGQFFLERKKEAWIVLLGQLEENVSALNAILTAGHEQEGAPA